MLKALDDPALFGPHFKGDTWQPWRAFLAALFALALSPEALALYTRHTGRTSAPTAAFVEAVLIVGRRGGKSRVLALIATFLACFRDYAPHLAPGEVATVAVLASDRRQARSIMRYVSGLVSAVPLLKAMAVDEREDSLTLNNRVVIEVSTASFRTTRGYSFAAVLADEVAFWRSDEASANPDTEILRALRPGMASIPGSVLLLASSPYAKRGELYRAFRQHYGKDDARVLVWKASTGDMNPRIDPAIIAEAYEADPESARAEYGGEFRDDLADFVTRETVDAATAWGCRERHPEPGVTYAAFCDPSGGANDAMTLAVAHLTPEGVAVLDAVRETRAPFDPEATVAEFADLLRTFGLSRVTGDRYGGLWPRQRFSEHGIEYEASARPKSDLYLDLLPLLNARRVELLDNPRLSAQLVGLERRTARSGRDTVDHTPGGHDDIANAVAGVLVGLDLDRRPAMVRASDLTRDGAALPMPATCDFVTVTVAVGKDALLAVIYAARNRLSGVPLTLLDFDVLPMGATTLAGITETAHRLGGACRARLGVMAFAPEGLVPRMLATGLNAMAMPEGLDDLDSLALAVAAEIGAGQVKITTEVADKAKTSPWGSALDFRSGDRNDTPLRMATLQCIAAALVNT